MIKITSTANKTITVSDNGTNGTSGTPISSFICLGIDCEVKVFDDNVDQFNYKYRVLRTVNITNKFTKLLIATVNVETLDTSSSSYSSNMDTYANNLISILYA